MAAPDASTACGTAAPSARATETGDGTGSSASVAVSSMRSESSTPAEIALSADSPNVRTLVRSESPSARAGGTVSMVGSETATPSARPAVAVIDAPPAAIVNENGASDVPGVEGTV